MTSATISVYPSEMSLIAGRKSTRDHTGDAFGVALGVGEAVVPDWATLEQH
jgi:hypothetical protein